MSNAGVSSFIIVDATCFIRAPETDDQVMQNELMVKFLMDARRYGYHSCIMYDDYDPSDITGSRKGAYSDAEDAIYDADDAYNALEIYYDIHAELLAECLHPYSEYQLADPERLIKDARIAEMEPPKQSEPLDNVAVIISPESEDDYGTLFGSYGLYISPAEIEDFEAFKDLSKRIKTETSLESKKKQSAANEGRVFLEMLEDAQIFEAAFGADSGQALEFLSQDPVIAGFLKDKPANIPALSGAPSKYISDEEFTLSRYFAALLKSQMYPEKHKTLIRDATWHQNELSKIPGGVQAAKRVERHAEQLSAPRSQM